MWLYTLILVWFVFLDIILKPNVDKNRKKIYLIFAILPLLFLSASRSINIGNDTITYHNLYFWSRQYSLEEFIMNYKGRWELGFLYLNKFLSVLFSNPQALIFISSMYIYIVLGWFLNKYSNNAFYSLFLFITMRYYFFFFSNIRQSIAIATLLIAFDFLVKEKNIKFILAVIIAYFFHTTAIVFLFALVIKIIPIRKSILIVASATSFFLFLIWKKIMPLINTYLPVKYQNYENTSYYLESGNLANYLNFLVILLITIICLYIFYKNKKIVLENKKLTKIYFYFPVVASSLALLSTQFGMFARVQYYFSFFFVIILPNMLNKLPSKEEKIIIYLVTIILFILYHTTILFFRPEWQHVYPFEFFWNHN